MAPESGGSEDFMAEDTYYRKISLHTSKNNQKFKESRSSISKFLILN